MKSDHELQRDVLDELAFEPRVDHAHIGVTARNGVITLTGFVDSYAGKLAAERAARRVKGVKAIAQDLEVRFASSPKTSDDEIAERVLQLFRWGTLVPDGLSVRVEHGWVTLTGTVEWQYQKNEAEKTVARISGVKGVSNWITLKPKVSAEDVQERIVAALNRARDLDASAIRVELDGDVVRLGGKVQGWNERRIAERAAWSAPGVTKVVDNIILA
jgi:osmotically-inducible protein OsmY